MKLRGSWGLVGNDQIGGERFIYMPTINLSGKGFTTGIDQNYGLSGPVYTRYETIASLGRLEKRSIWVLTCNY